MEHRDFPVRDVDCFGSPQSSGEQVGSTDGLAIGFSPSPRHVQFVGGSSPGLTSSAFAALRARAGKLGARMQLELSENAADLVGHGADLRAANASDLSVRLADQELGSDLSFGLRQFAEVA